MKNKLRMTVAAFLLIIGLCLAFNANPGLTSGWLMIFWAFRLEKLINKDEK